MSESLSLTRGDFTLYPISEIPKDGSRFFLVARSGHLMAAKHMGKKGLMLIDPATGLAKTGDTMGYHAWCRPDGLHHLLGKLMESLYD